MLLFCCCVASIPIAAPHAHLFLECFFALLRIAEWLALTQLAPSESPTFIIHRLPPLLQRLPRRSMTSKVVFKNPVPSDIEVSQSITPTPIKEIAGEKSIYHESISTDPM